MAARILIVDDSPAMRSFVRRIVQISGIETEWIAEAGDGKQALEAVAQRTPDLILCDVNMPVMSGEQLVAELSGRGALNEIAVIVVSTDATRTRVGRILDLGARGYVCKPFSPEELRSAIEQACPQLFAEEQAQ